MYSALGRINLLLAYCSRMWPVQPEMRLTAKIGRVEIERDAHEVVGRGRVEIDVREHALFLVHQLLDALGHVVPLHLALLLGHVL